MNAGSQLPVRLWPLLLLLVSLSLSALLWHSAEGQVEREWQSAFEHRAQEIRERIKSSLAIQDQHLHSLAGLFHASPLVTQASFHRYYESIQPQGQVPDFAAMVYLQHIAGPDAKDFHTAIRYIEPLTESNRRVIGFDSSSVPAMRAGMQYGRDTTGVGMSPKVSLVQDADKPVPGFVLYLPLYQRSQADTASESLALVTGWVGMSFRMAPLMNRLLQSDLKDMDVHIYQGMQATPESLFYGSNPAPAKSDWSARLRIVQQLDFGGQSWTLVLQAKPGFVPATAHSVALLTAAVGVLLSLALSYALLQWQRRDRRRVAAIERNATEAQAQAHESQRLLTMRELQTSEQDARQSEARARNALAQLEMQRFALDQHAIVAHTDLQGRITHVNDRFCEVSGYSRSELMGQDHAMLTSGMHPEGFFRQMYQQLASGQTWHGEVCNRAKNGTLYWLRTTITPFPGADGKPASYVAIRTDITNSRLAESKLAEREAIYRTIVTQAREGIALIDPASQRFVEFNNAFCMSLGYGREEFAQLPLSAIQGDLDEAALTQRLQDEVASGHASFDTLYRRKNGELFNVHVGSRKISLAGNTYLVAVVSDNTDRIRAQQAQEDAREFLQQIVAQVPGCVFQARLTPAQWFSFPFASDGIFELLGLHPQQVQEDAAPAFRLTLPQDRPGLVQSMRDSARDLTPWQQEFQVQLPKGVRWLAGSAVPQRAHDGGVVWHGFITDISERKRAEVELAQYRDNLEDLVQQKTAELSASAAATRLALNQLEQQKFVLDQHAIVSISGIDGAITYGNDKFAEISGYSRDEFIGQDHQLSNSGHHPKGFFREMYAVIAGGGVWHAEVCNRAKDGTLYWVDSTVAAFMGKDGKPQEYIAVRTDITKRKRIEAITRQAEESAQAANRSKSEFLANMSHEIRTPMNGVIGMVDILQQTELQPAQARMLETIHKSSLALLNILNDILDFSKIEAGKLEVERIPTHVREVVEGVAQVMLNVADSKHAQISVFVDPTLPDWVLSDPTRLRQILFNLLSNALKFINTGLGHVMLHVHRVERPDGSPCLQFCVLDNGIGMDQAVVAKLFQPFTQADASTARMFGGTGLGLSITQGLVVMMGGTITVHSRVSMGSEFTVELPLHQAQAPAGRLLAVVPSLAGLQVLAVTDSGPCATLLQVYLSSAGARVQLVANLQLAQRQLKLGKPVDVLLLDLAQASPEATAGWQGLNWPAQLQMVQLLPRDSPGDGAAEHAVLANPLLYHELLQCVAVAAGRLAALELPTLSHAIGLPASQPAATVPEALAAGRLILVAEDNETNCEVIAEQLQLLGFAAEMAGDGVAALQMWRDGLAAHASQHDRYALLLTDCHMPRMDGFELTNQIRLAQRRHLPIVAITANAMQGEAQRCRERGMDDYLSKPLRLNELAAMLHKWLPLVEPPAPAPAPTPAPALRVWNPDALGDLVGNNPALHSRLLRKFLLSAQAHVTALLGAAAAEPVDCQTIALQAHTLKSSARSVGAQALGELCQALETIARQTDAGAASVQLIGTLEEAWTAVAAKIETHLEHLAATQPAPP